MEKPRSLSAPVQVYLRIRPLIPEEEGDDLIDYKVDDDRGKLHLKLPDRGSRPNPNGAFAHAPPFRHRQEKYKTYGGFAAILGVGCDNETAYETSVKSLIDPVAANESACIFTYGHTGSGKSHTLLGYGDESGAYKFAAADLLESIQRKDPARCLLVRVTELYKDQVRDLVTNRECSIRQDANGEVRVRGPMEEDDKGRIEQLPLGRLCGTAEEVVECVDGACATRQVGTSTHHDQSSRSHLVLEMEIVTPELMDKRGEFSKHDAHLTRLKWLQTEKIFQKHKDRPLPKWTEDYASPTTLRREIKQYEELVDSSKKELRRASAGLGGTLVFCDLAGNEYARDSAGSTAAEREEAAEINRSLLAVKEMLRSLSQTKRENSKPKGEKGKRTHVPFRDSKLTMCLRRHLETRAVMLAHISPSAESRRKTANTLGYCAVAGAPMTAGGRERGRGKENNE